MIAVIGSLNMDLVTTSERTPRQGETVIGRDFKKIPGGKGANQADTIAKLGGKVSMIGCVGNDEFGGLLIESLKVDGVEIDNISTTEKACTGIASISVDKDGNNSIIVVPGANYMLTYFEIEKAISTIERASIVINQLEVPIETVCESLKLAKQLKKYTILNPAPAVKLSDEIYKNTDLITPNETELEVLCDISTDSNENIVRGARVLIERGVGSVIVTLGEKGCMYVTKDSSKSFSPYKVAAIDTTAAGDSFTAALALALDEGKNMEQAIDFAMATAGVTVTREGAQSSLPSRAEVEALIASR